MKSIEIGESINELMASIRKLIDKEIWESTFLFSVVAGVIVHLLVLTNYITNHDSICLTGNNGDWLLGQGKWFVTPVSSLEGPLDVFFLSGVIGIVAVSLAAVVFCIHFEINSVWKCRLIGLCFVSYPSIATMSLYHAIDYFGITFLLAVLGAYFMCQKKLLNSIVGITLVVLSLGAYQAYVGATLVILVLDCLVEILRGDKFEKTIYRGIQHIVKVSIAMGTYYIVLKIILSVKNVELSSYKGIDNMTQNLRPDILLNSIIVALSSVKTYLISDVLGIYTGRTAYLNITLIILLVIVEILLIKKNNLKIKEIVLIILLTLVCLPLGVNIIGVLSANTSFYYITVAPFVLLFAVPIVISELLNSYISSRIAKSLATVILCITFLVGMDWIIQNNIVYQKLVFVHQEYDAKLSILANQIQENENFTEDVKVVVVGEAPYNFLESAGVLKTMEEIFTTKGYGLGNSDRIVYSEAILFTFLYNKYAITFDMIKYDESMEIPISEIEEMEIYPNYGSIKSYKDKILVKLSNNL